MSIDSYRDLIVWQKSMALVLDCYAATRSFPDSERFGLSSQLQRAAVSIPANIAEGRSRGHLREFLRQLGIACGSLAELETHIEIGRRLSYIDGTRGGALADRTAEVGRMLTRLRTSLRRRL
ncbi:MAG: four helix bundle protein [Planctomycetaceae bacterium]